MHSSVVHIFWRATKKTWLEVYFERQILVGVEGFQSPNPVTAAAQSQQETKLQMDWKILMCATRGCLRASLNNLGKCVVTTANLSLVCLTMLCSIHPQLWPTCLDIMARLVSLDRHWLMQFSFHWWNFIFLWSSQTPIQDLLTTHIPISLLSYTEILLGWSRANTT